MSQEELLAFIIERGSVTSGEVAAQFGIPITFAHQALRRLEDRGILGKNGGPYRFKFYLSPAAKRELQKLNGNPAKYGWIFLAGLAVGVLIGLGSRNRGNNYASANKNKKDKKKQP